MSCHYIPPQKHRRGRFFVVFSRRASAKLLCEGRRKAAKEHEFKRFVPSNYHRSSPPPPQQQQKKERRSKLTWRSLFEVGRGGDDAGSAAGAILLSLSIRRGHFSRSRGEGNGKWPPFFGGKKRVCACRVPVGPLPPSNSFKLYLNKILLYSSFI